MLQKAICSIGWSTFQGCKSVETPGQEIDSATYIVSVSHWNAMIPHRADRPCMSKARTVSGMALVPGDTEDLRSNGASRLPALD